MAERRLSSVQAALPAAQRRTSLAAGSGRQSLGPTRVKSGGANVGSATNEMAGMSVSNDGAGGSSLGQRKVSLGRSSIDPRESLNRRSSAFGKNMATGTYPGGKDPRPIREKSFQLEVIKGLINFLAKSGYPHPISQKILTAPSAKDFQNIFKFLYSQVDVGYDFGKKFEDEVPIVMKGLRYPFAGDISKSQLYAVGSMHAWPGLLALLGWMVDLITCCELVNGQDEQSEADGGADDRMSDGENDGDEEERRRMSSASQGSGGSLQGSAALGGSDGGAAAKGSERIFFDYLCKSYKVFLSGSDNFEPLIGDLSAAFERKNAATFREIASLEKAVAELDAEYQGLVHEEAPLAKAEREYKIYVGDVEKFEKFISHLHVKSAKFEEAIRAITAEIASFEEALEKIEIERSGLQAQVDAQNICPEDIDKMNADKEQLCKTLESLSSAKEETQRIFWERELVVQKKLDAVEKLVQEYNFSGEQLALIPREAAHAGGVDFEIIFNAHATRIEELTNCDLAKTIYPALNALRDSCHGAIHGAQDQLLSLQETLDRLSEACNDKMDQVRTTEKRIERILQSYLEDKESINAENKRIDNEVDTLEQTIQKLRSDITSQSLQSQQRLQRTTIDYDQLLIVVASEKERIGNEMYRLLEELINFKTNVESSLEDLQALFAQER